MSHPRTLAPSFVPSHRRTLAPRTVDQRGVALVIVMMAITLLAALGAVVTLATTTETAIAANYRDVAEALHAAEAAVEFVMQEVADVPDWRDVLSQSGQSSFVDGPAGGVRDVGSVTLDLVQATRDVEAMAAAGPGAARPVWVLYAFGRFEDLMPSNLGRSGIYVAVWVADRSDPPAEEGAMPEALSILGQAYGARGSRRTVETIVVKADTSTIRAVAWRELR